MEPTTFAFVLGGSCLGAAMIGVGISEIRGVLVRRHGEDRRAILAAVRTLGSYGYARMIEQEAEKQLGRRLQFGGLFFHLSRLEAEGLIRSRWLPGAYPRRRAYFIAER